MVTNDSAQRLTKGAEIGKGTFGVVHRGAYRGLPVAIKRLQLGAPGAPELQQLKDEFRLEVAMCCALRHPNVVAFYGYTTRPEVVMVQELAARSLHDLLKSGAALLPAEQLGFVRDVAEGMRYLHARSPPVIHRDLKSLNLLVMEAAPPYTVKITDFGLARAKAYVGGQTAAMTQVSKTPSWARSRANFGLSSLCFHRRAWATVHVLGQPDALLRRRSGRPTGPPRRSSPARTTRRRWTSTPSGWWSGRSWRAGCPGTACSPCRSR
jgi:serine/threonine protein kinase